MKNLMYLLLLLGFTAQAQSPTLKSVLLKQLKTTHNTAEWFVPVNTAIDGLTLEQAAWKDESGNHSIGQLVNHLAFWNERELNKFQNQKNADFSGNNTETFDGFDQKKWMETTKKLDAVLSGWEEAIEAADDVKLKDWYATIANISAHNAYHTGQIIYIRKMKGNWNPDKGVK